MNHLKIFEEFNYDKLILEIKTFELKKIFNMVKFH